MSQEHKLQRTEFSKST